MKSKRNVWVIGILCLFLSLSKSMWAQSDPVEKLEILGKAYQNATTDSLKIERLYDVAQFYLDYLGDEHKADSISELALDVAISTYRPEMLVLAYNLYLESNELSAFYSKSFDYAQKALQYSKNINNISSNCRSCKNLSAVYLAAYEYEKALEYGFRALSLADGLDDDMLKAESYLVIGASLEGKNQAVDAFRNYLGALAISEHLKHKELLKKSYAALSDFYKKNKIFDKATFYKLKEGDLVKATKPIDSLAMMWIVYDLQVIALHANSKLTEKFTQNILRYAVKHGVHRLKEFEMALYRTYLVKHEDYKQLQSFYADKYPNEYRRMAKENPALYYTLQAYFAEYGGMVDTAKFYFETAEFEMQSSPNKILQANFYNRFGQFLIRHNQAVEAIGKFSKAYHLAKESNYSEYMFAAVEQLESLYVALNQYEDAYNYAKVKSELKESLEQASKKDQMIILEINHETEQRAIKEDLELKRIERRHNIQYTGIVIAILILFVILIMFGSFKVPKWLIQMLGFFSFIFLFEFIILLADHRIHHWTHGEPWKIMLIKIFLIAFLLPFHHWIEKQVVGYLLNHRLVNFIGFAPIHFLKKITGIGVDGDDAH